MSNARVTTPSDTEILITREFDAPKHAVWRAFTEPDLVSRWWPGRRGTMQSCEIDLRVGGAWRFVMVTSEHYVSPFPGEHRDIVAEEQIVNTEVYEGAPGPGDVVMNTFTSDARRT